MRRWTIVLLTLLVCCSCSKDDNRKAVFPVTGKILVDGKPVADIAIRCVDQAGFDRKNPTTSHTFTKPDGSFAISTYKSGDGVPVGDYVITLEWGQRNLISMQYGGPDKLNGKYADPKTSEIKFSVKPGVPTDLGTINVTTK